jgi:DNA repair photolyase
MDSCKRINDAKTEISQNQSVTSQSRHKISTPKACSSCGKVFHRESSLSNHFKMNYGKGCGWKCLYCPFVTKYKQSVQVHIWRRHKNMPNIA